MSLKNTPHFELRSGSVDTFLFIVKTPDLETLRAELLRRFAATPEFFTNDAVVIDLRYLQGDQRVSLAALAGLLVSVRMRPIGVIADDTQQAWASAGSLPLVESPGRRLSTSTDLADVDGEIAWPTLVVDRPLRSGQQVYAKGNLVVLGLVSYGAEVIAEGNLHIYAPLRGRAIAGVQGHQGARIFCTCLEPELISIAGVYRTAETPLPPDMQSGPVQVRLVEEKLLIEPLRLT